MKKKVTTYILLIAAVAVWGLIAYRIIEAVEANETSDEIPEVSMVVPKEKYVDTDTFSISLNYSDPFFKKVSRYIYRDMGVTDNGNANMRPAPISSNNQPGSNSISRTSVSGIDWSFIKFNGLIRNSQTKSSVALVNIHQKGHMMKEGDVLEGVKLLKAYKDSIVVKYMNLKKTIQR